MLPSVEMVRLSWATPAAAGLFLLLASSPVFAEPSAAELASARDMFAEARRAEDAGHWAEALSKLQAVANVKMTPQVRFHLGLCQEHTGQLVEALNNFELARAEASEQGVATVVDEARDHASDLRARVPKLKIDLPAGVPSKLVVDGRPITQALLDRPLPLDPGRHTIAATAPGLAFSREVTLAEHEEGRIEIVFSPAPGTTTSKPRAKPEAAGPAPREADAPGSSSSGPPIGGIVVLGAGGLALAGSVTAALVRQSAISHIDRVCQPICKKEDEGQLTSDQSKARTFGGLAVGLGIGGAALAATGVILILSSRSSPKQAFTWTPWIGATGIGAGGTLKW